jgi:hypothetical protein
MYKLVFEKHFKDFLFNLKNYKENPDNETINQIKENLNWLIANSPNLHAVDCVDKALNICGLNRKELI